MGKEVIKKTIKIGDEDRVVNIVPPSPRVDSEANMYASQVFARLIREKDENNKPRYIVRDKLDEYLREMEIYTDQDIVELAELSRKIKALEDGLIKGGKSKAKGREDAINLRKARYAMYSLMAKKIQYDKNTVEYYAENARMNFLVTKCITFESGDPIFNNVEDYESDSNMQEILAEPIRELASLVSTFDPNFEDKLPENKFLKKYGFCNDAYDLVDSKGRRVDEKGRLVNEEGQLINEDGVAINEDGSLLNQEIGEFTDDEVQDVPVVETTETIVETT